MTTTQRTPLAELDEQIAEAWAEVVEARQRWSHSPNGDTIAAERTAVAVLNELLELRYIVG